MVEFVGLPFEQRSPAARVPQFLLIGAATDPVVLSGTRPMLISIRTTLDACSATAREFEVLTAGAYRAAYPESARRHAGYRANVIEFRRDIEPHNRHRRSRCTGSKRLPPRACATRAHMIG